MNKNVLWVILAVGMVGFSGYGVYKSVTNKPLPPELELKNIEALAGNESGGVTVESCLGLWDKCKDGKGPWVKVKY